MLVRTISGEAWFATGERQIHAKAGDTYLISLDQDFRGRMTDYQAQILYLPRDAFRSVAADFDKLCNMILPGSLIGLLGDHLGSLENRLVDMGPEELAQAGRATVDLIAASIQPLHKRLQEALGAIDTVLFERANVYIQSHLANPDLAPEDLMQAIGVSRSNLYRAFEHVGGVSRHIQSCRLLAARSALRRGGRIQDIAYNHGFSSGTVFARAFRREFGYSPSKARDRSDPETGET
ncbi:AraC family transcriptional regulator [Methylovirgula sp. 4M-Z18]|nr:AraC family transcriptional regulator [Methylovirgula sp. 4M-Z18]